MFKIIIHGFQMTWIVLFMIIIHLFQMDINCILIKYYFNVYIIIHVFQMDFICFLILNYFNVYDQFMYFKWTSFISTGF